METLLKPIRSTVLNAAETIICGNREDDYGKPEDSFAAIADMWSAYVHNKYKGVFGHLIEITEADVAHMMVLLKCARATGKYKFDNYVDMAGYAALAAEIQEGVGDE